MLHETKVFARQVFFKNILQEEIHPPEIKDLLSGCDDIYSRDQVKQLERVILNALRFDLLVPTSQFFLEYFSSCVISNYSGFHADRLRYV